MRLISWNVNGMRACARKGFLDWLKVTQPDVVALQETRATEAQLEGSVRSPRGYHPTWNPAERLGYSGVATLSRTPHEVLASGLGEARFDIEGRTLATRHPGEGDLVVTLVNGYFPNGQRDLSRVPYKLEYTEAVFAYANALRAQGHLVVVCGDVNTAHEELDLRNWRANRKTTGFLDEEREALGAHLGPPGSDRWVDAFRALHPGEPNRYTWWSNRKGVRERNVGWRIDYHLVAPELWPRVVAADILAEVLGSDHCPIKLTLR